MDRSRRAAGTVLGDGGEVAIVDTLVMSSRGLSEAIRLLKAEKRKPTNADRPPPGTFNGPKIKPLPGQLVLGQDVERDELVAGREEAPAS